MERLTIPEEAEVKAALQELQLRQPGMGIAKMVESIKTGHPSWALSVDVGEFDLFLETNSNSPAEGTQAAQVSETRIRTIAQARYSTRGKGGTGQQTPRPPPSTTSAT